MTAGEYWKRYLKDTGKSENEAVYSGELIFEDSGFTGQTQLELVLSEKKTASFTPFDSFSINMERLPVAGEVYIVEGSDEKPRCIIEVTDVKIVPFDEIPWSLAQRDGEDESLKDWHDKQKEFFIEEADLCGFEYSEHMNVVCEIFKLIYCRQSDILS